MRRNLVQEILSMGDAAWLQSDQVFCFGDRQTKKTTNMVLAAFLRFIENPINPRFTVLCLAPNRAIGNSIVDFYETIAQKLKLEVAVRSKEHIIIMAGQNVMEVYVKSTDNGIRGFAPDFIQLHNANYLPRNIIRSVMVIDKDFVISGDSFYPMAINPAMSPMW